nr:zinc finger RING domain containing protein 2 [Hymenolepis microstoma]
MRGSAYRREATAIVEENQNDALNTTMRIVQSFGPMGFLIHEENGNQKHKKESDNWRKISQNFGSLIGFERRHKINDDNWPETAVEGLIRPLSRRELYKIPKWIIKADIRSSIPGRCEGGRKEAGHALGLLAPGQQCRICLMHFQEGEEVRSLLNCNHVFHSNCVDPWLLHLSPCCPLDGKFAAKLMSARSDQNAKSTSDIRWSSLRNTPPSLNNMGDALKIISISNTANKAPLIKHEARESNYPITRHSSLEPRSRPIYPRPHIRGSTHSALSIGPVCKSVQELSNSLRRISDKYRPKL